MKTLRHILAILLFAVALHAVPSNNPNIEITDASVNEADGSVSLIVATDRCPNKSNITVAYSTAIGTAVGGSDYTTTSGTVTFTTVSCPDSAISIAILDDALVEGDETFTVNFSVSTGAQQNYTLVNSSATVTIMDDDSLSSSSVSSSSISSSSVSSSSSSDDSLELPEEQQNYTCGVFPSVLASYISIDAMQNDVMNSCYISVKDYDFDENSRGRQTVTCYEDEGSTPCVCTGDYCSEDGTCTIIPEPKNRYDHVLYDTIYLDEDANITGDDVYLTALYEYSYTFTAPNQNITLDPQTTYANSDRPVMILGDIINNKNGQTITFKEGDYYMNSWDMDWNQVNLVIEGNVNIYITENFMYDGNHMNAANDDSLFIYVGGDVEFGSNGGGNSWLGMFLYVEGNVLINSNANAADFFGGITAEGYIDITGMNMNFIYNRDGADYLGLGECQLCYDNPVGMAGYYVESFQGTMTVPVKNISPVILTDVNVTEAQMATGSGTSAPVDWGTNFDVVDETGATVAGTSATFDSAMLTDLPMSFDTSLADGSITYEMGSSYPMWHTTAEYYAPDKFFTSSIMYETWFDNTIYMAEYIDDVGRHYHAEIPFCGEVLIEEDIYLTGPFDAWDVNRSIYDRNISTKISARDFSLVIASINEENNATEVKENIDFKYRLVDMNSGDGLSSWTDYNASAGQDGAEAVKLFQNIDTARRDVRVQFAFCSDYVPIVDGTVILPFGNCAPADINYSVYSSDNFAIRPNRYIMNSPALGSTITAGQTFTLEISAVDDNINPAADYTTTLPEDDFLFSDRLGCFSATDIADDFNATLAFVDGAMNDTARFDEVGDINITIFDQEWTLVDQNGKDCVPDTNESNTTHVGCWIGSDMNLSFIADDYNITSFAVGNHEGNTYTYFENNVSEMAADLNFSISALNALGDVTAGFSDGCYANNMNMTFTFDQQTDAPVQSRMMTIRDDNNLTFDANTTLDTDALGASIDFVVASTYFAGGAANNLNRHINYNREANNTLQPVVLTPLTLQATDAVTGESGTLMTNPVGDATFVYGRIHAPRYRYECTALPCDGTATLYYEVFCNNCTMVRLPNGVNSQLSLNSMNWFINLLHDPTDEGGVAGTTDISQINGAAVNATAIDNNPPAPSDATLRYDGSQDFPYKTTIQMAPSQWLIYNRFNINATANEFDVEFYRAGGEWTGTRETETTTDSDAAVNTNRRIQW